MTDLLKKYLFEDRTVRVQAVRLHETWREAQVNHDYPPAVKRLLGELIAAATLLAANLKFEGSLVMQVQGDGPIALLVVECRADLSLRATVKLRQDRVVPDTGTMQTLMNPGGNGRFIVVLDPQRKAPGQQPYQGIVPIVGETVADALSHYMQQSEQLDTRLWLAADDSHVAGLLLQRLPDQGGAAVHPGDPQESWNRAVHLTETLQADELRETDIDTLIHRLYWEETLIAFEPAQVRWHCPCNRTKVSDMLRMLGREEIEEILAERGKVEVACDFCGKPYAFDAVDCAGLFSGPQTLPEQDPPTVH
ncbi:Hsp33 family molecular chaperone [Bordetella genomosp. 9]|uniref:Hsp33 family molecular chaperone HslO n=1 Tax=Bordetella genomosp. 9 TaxID=1416803 RepID=UPI000A28E130|nr:Hsp33 family molecular chaperone HslO [Bordetella genomosp. 9]ARP91277.1 Hsp33 family molecular chaperone [Bordetella genomosp. 9]